MFKWPSLIYNPIHFCLFFASFNGLICRPEVMEILLYWLYVALLLLQQQEK